MIISNTIIEVLTGYNPIYEFLIHSGLYNIENAKHITEVRFGLKRAQSIFSMHTTLGGYAYLVFGFYSYLTYKISKTDYKYGILAWALLACAFLTGARSAIIGCVIAMMIFVNKKTIRQMHKGVLFLAAIALLTVGSVYISTIYGSFVDTNAVSGSNTDMRTIQYEISLFYFLQSPLIGNGLSYTWNVALVEYPELYGAESVWFPYMIDQGLLGCIAWLSFSICALIYLSKNGMASYGWVILGWVVFSTLSSIPGITDLFFCNLILLAVEAKKIKSNLI